ncbi:nitroreductase family protein [Alicyclobacillus pomorum]|jgi:nitroreductase|uniref:nitroreductase family protein n=1 Tax=Alicyclobacillus pomorum TaxID=204470 RepID=UPI0004136976|nr:nitroreductase family protein [Alicyclobacillus pomorum]
MTVRKTDELTTKVAEHRTPTYEIEPIFLNRWSPRAYSEQPIDDETLFRIFEAARWAPSSYNLQPWRFIVAKSEEDRSKFLSFIFEGNVTWCKKAPVLAVLVSHTVNSNGEPNHKHAFDAGAAWGYLALQATQLGIYTHAMGGFDREKAREVLQLPAEYEPQIVISLGYYGDPQDLPEALRAREVPSTRRPLSEIVFEGQFGGKMKSL